MEHWIRRACRQRANRQLVAWFVATVLIVFGLVAMHDYWLNFFEGPLSISESNLGALSAVDQSRPFATVTGSQVVDSGVREYTTETRNGAKEREYVSSSYSVLLVGRTGLVVKGNASLAATGELKPLPANIPSLIFPDDKDTDLRSRLFPVLLDTTSNYRVTGYVVIGVLLIYAWAAWVYVRRAVGYTKDVSTHPVVKRIEAWTDAAEVISLSEREKRSPRFKANGIRITESFVIVSGFFSFNLLAWNQLLWAYRKQTTTRYYYVVPIARSQDAMLHFYGGDVSFRAGKKRVEEILLYAHQKAPWAVLGYTDELQQVWRKKTTEFAAAVEARRAELL